MHFPRALPVVLAAASFALVSAAGCAKLVGADFSDPTLASADVVPAGCALPSTGDARVRLADFSPATSRVDFCIGPANSTAPLRPLLASTGRDCPAGLGYQQVLAPVSLAAGAYRVVAIPAGGSCGDPAVASAAVTLATEQTATVALVGASSSASLLVLPEGTAAGANASVRLVHALNGAPALDFDQVSVGADSLPANVTASIARGVPFGAASAPSNGSANAQGYVSVPPSTSFGASPSGAADVTLSLSPALASGGRYSVYASGHAGDVDFPAELYLCDELKTDGLFTACGNGSALDVSFEAYDIGLNGVFSPDAPHRKQAAVAAAPNLGSDVICLSELARDDDKRAIAQSALSTYPYSLWYADSASTTPSDPRDAQGNVPVPPTAASCPASVGGLFDGLLSCLETNCAAAPHDASASLMQDPSACMVTYCKTQVLNLFNTAEQRACWMCFIAEVEDGTSFSSVRDTCTTNAGSWPVAFKGATNSLLLSRYPIVESETAQWVLPATLGRPSILRAGLALPNGATVDAYCGSTSGTPLGSSQVLLPYTGPYGGPDPTVGWQVELHLQIQQLLDFMQRSSIARGRRALLLGHLNTGPALPSQAVTNPDSYALLGTLLGAAMAPGYVPQCTYCVTNPLVSAAFSSQDVWLDPVFLGGIPVTSVIDSTITHKDAVLTNDAGGEPLSQYYGYRTVVRIHP